MIQIPQRILLGLVFVFLGSTKMQDISSLEVLLFRIGPKLSFDIYSFAARLIVSFYWIVAFLVIGNIQLKLAKRIGAFILLVSILGIVYDWLQPTSDVFFGWGRGIKILPHIDFIVCISILIILFKVKSKNRLSSVQLHKSVKVLSIILLLLLPHILSLPSIYYKSTTQEVIYNDSTLQAELVSNSIPAHFVQDKKVLVFYSVNCRFCRYSAERLSTTFKKYKLARNNMQVVFWATKVDPTLFWEITNSYAFEYTPLPTEPFMSITKGKMPLILLIEDGKVIHSMRYANLDESVIINFLKT